MSLSILFILVKSLIVNRFSSKVAMQPISDVAIDIVDLKGILNIRISFQQCNGHRVMSRLWIIRRWQSVFIHLSVGTYCPGTYQAVVQILYIQHGVRKRLTVKFNSEIVQ